MKGGGLFFPWIICPPDLQAYHKRGDVALHPCFTQSLPSACTALYGLVQAE